jgi:prepilin-type N-terminal cleavage/methylation domain-containing protein
MRRLGRKVWSKAMQSRPARAFTLLELLVVLVIMAIVGAMVVPLVSGMGAMEAMSAARIISTDLEYAQNVAITSQVPVTVQFNLGADSYGISNASGPLKHPITHADYLVDLRSQHDFDRLDIVSASFAGSQSVTFDELGSPDNGGFVTVQGGPDVYRVDVSPVTGTIAVTRVGS